MFNDINHISFFKKYKGRMYSDADPCIPVPRSFWTDSEQYGRVRVRTMKNFSKNFVWAIIILMALSVVYSSVAGLLIRQKEISLSDVVAQVNAGEVAEIAVTDAALEVKLKNGETVVAQKEPEAGLTETLRNFGVEPARLRDVKISVQTQNGLHFLLAVILPILGPVLLIAFFVWFTARQVQRGSMQAFSFGQSRARLIGPEGQKERITFKDVAGVKEAKEELKEIVDFLKNPKKYLDIGAKIPKGVLLMGAPGSGKTLLAKAVSGESGVPFFHMSASEFIEMFVGVGASRTRDLFRIAKKAAPAIIFIDELDAIGRIRGAGLGGGHDEREQTLNQILVEMDGMETDARVIVMAASVTGDTPVLIREHGVVRACSIGEAVDRYYQSPTEEGEKETPDLEVLGFEKREGKQSGFRYAHRSAFSFGGAAFKKARSVFRHRVGEIYEITYLGGTIRATGNHSVFVRSRQGIITKAVSELRAGDMLVDLPYTVNRTNKKLREARAFDFAEVFEMELPVWFPLFEQFAPVRAAYEYALARADSQARLGAVLGFSQRTIGKWQEGVCGPRALSRNYYQHHGVLPERVRVTPDLARLMGYYVAEGYARKEIDFCFNEKETEYIEDVKRLMKDVFNISPHAERRVTPHAVNVLYQCKPVAQFFIHHCGTGAHHKHIPSFLWSAPRSYFVEFMRGYLAGDGHQDKRGRMEATSVSRQLIFELNWLARMHGFKSFVHSFTAKEGRSINGGKPLRSVTAWRLGFGKTQNPIGTGIGAGNTKRAIVKKVTRLPFEGFVYDFCGCDNEAFFGGVSPVLLHNTNRPDVLDPALLRPGRFDRRVVLDLPDINDREEILKIHAHNKPLADDVRLRVIAERTPGFSGADLANLVNEAAILTARENKKQVSQIHLVNSIEKVLLGPERKSHLLTVQEKKISAYHEAGHALVAACLKNADPVHKVSIVSRGRAAGYTLKLPLEDRHLYSRSHFIDELASALGGYAAEEIVFGEITTGPHDDLKKATDVARGLVTRFGMSDAVGPVALGDREEMVFLGRELTTERNYSEMTAELIDREVKRFMDEARRTAGEIVGRRRDTLDAIAAVLLEKETIEREEFDVLVKENGEKGK